jgi:5-formyltetrahydrofolate cyclo-ligase
MSDNQQLKATIRQSIRIKRKNLTAAEKDLAGKLLSEQLANQPIIAKQQHIACFLSFDGEISTHTIIQQIFQQKQFCYLPKLKPYKPNRLWFMPYTPNSKMQANRFAIDEVDQLPNHAIAISKLDVVLLPLVAFDKQGNRLGMGGGFYDATFAHLRKKQRRPLFIGLAYQAQLVKELPSDRWDLPLDGVCTEKNFYLF